MTDGPYDYAAEREDAADADNTTYRRINGYYYDDTDLPDKDDL